MEDADFSFDRTKPLWSLTIKQFRGAREEVCEKYREFFIDGDHKVFKVKLVAQVVNNSLRETRSAFFGLLADSTGELPFVVYTLDNTAVVMDESSQFLKTAPAAFKLHTYYEFIGTYKFLEKARSDPPTQYHFEILYARRIVNFDAVTVHMLQCIHHHLLRTRGPPPPREDDAFFEDDGGGEEDCC